MSELAPESFATFGALLRYLRRRSRITQRALGIAVGYSEAHIARLESDQRTPDPDVVSAQFVDALGLTASDPISARMINLAKLARGTGVPPAAVSPTKFGRPLDPAIPTNLRAQLTTFIGRNAEVTQAMRLLADARLLTITGTGGVGKSRLAMQLAGQVLRNFPDGVWVIALAAIENPAHVSVAAAHA